MSNPAPRRTQPTEMPVPAWPDRCHDTASCERHRMCMYHQCVHTGKGSQLGAEIDRAIADLVADDQSGGNPVMGDVDRLAMELALLLEPHNYQRRKTLEERLVAFALAIRTLGPPKPAEEPISTKGTFW